MKNKPIRCYGNTHIMYINIRGKSLYRVDYFDKNIKKAFMKILNEHYILYKKEGLY